MTSLADWDAIDWVWVFANWPWLIVWLLGCGVGVFSTLIGLVVRERLQKK